MENLRHVKMVAGSGNVYTLRTWDCRQTPVGPGHQHLLGYEFKQNGAVLFTGENFGCSPLDAIDSDDCLRAILGFLTLSPGDTDKEWFEAYTPAQMAFAEGDAEDLSTWARDGEEGAEPFEEIEEETEEGPNCYQVMLCVGVKALDPENALERVNEILGKLTPESMGLEWIGEASKVFPADEEDEEEDEEE